MMPVTWRASFSYLLRHPWQLSLSLLGIGVGVAVIVAVDLANASARKAFLLSMDAITGEATHQVIGGPRGVPESVYADLRLQGFRSIAPVVEGTVFSEDQRLTLLGVDLFAEQEMRSFTAEASDDDRATLFTAFLVSPGTVTTTGQTAQDLGVSPGDTFPVRTGSREQSATLLSLFPGDDRGLDRVLVADVATAQEWLDQAGWLTRIDVRIADGDEKALTELQAALPDGLRLLTAAGRTRSTADMSAAFMTNLTAMSLLALLVGLFLIFNSVSFSVLQRRPLIGVLRALGLTRRELLAMILVESAFVGLVAAVLGVLFGIFLGEQLLDLVTRSINDFYYRVSVTSVSVDAASVAKGLVAGVGAALLAATFPALEATSYEPRLALTRSVVERRATSALPALTISGLAIIVAASVLIGFSGTGLFAGLIAVFMLIFGFALCVPLFVRFAAELAAPLAQKLAGTPARMAVGGIATSLSRTGVAIVALAVAVSATIGVTVMVDSFRGSVSAWLEETLQADIYAGAPQGNMDPALVEALRNLDGVAASSTSRRVTLEDARGRMQLQVVEMAPGSYAGTELIDSEPERVWPQWDSGDVVLVSEPFAFQQGVAAGDVVTLPTDHGPRDFDVAAMFQSFDINASLVLMSRATYARHFRDDAVDSVGLYLDDDADIETVITAVHSAADGIQPIRVASNAGLREESLRIFDRTFVITDVLYWLALGVAFIGILSAMLALQLERAREFATLRALGMTPRQVGGLITAQTGVIGLLSGLAALPLGIVMAWVLIKVINRRAFGWQIDMSVAPGILATSVAFAIGAALLAGLYPAWRAGRSQPAIAMREE